MATVNITTVLEHASERISIILTAGSDPLRILRPEGDQPTLQDPDRGRPCAQTAHVALSTESYIRLVRKSSLHVVKKLNSPAVRPIIDKRNAKAHDTVAMTWQQKTSGQSPR